MKRYHIPIFALLFIILFIMNTYAIAAPQTSTVSQNKSVLSKGMELLLGGYLKGAVAGVSNTSMSDLKKSYSAAKNDIKLSKKYFEEANVTNINEKSARDQLVLIADYYIDRMDFLSGEKEAIREFISGIVAMDKGEYDTAKSNFNSALSLYSKIEQSRASMESKAKKIDIAAWDIVIPKHENLTYIEKDLKSFAKDWASLSQTAIYLCNAGIAKKQGDEKKVAIELKNALILLNALKDSPIVGKQASVWNANLERKSS